MAGTPQNVDRFLADTSVLIAHLRQQPPTLLHRALTAYGIPFASDVTLFELEVGARRAGRKFEYQRHFASIKTLRLTQRVLIQAAIIQADLLAKNQVIGLADTFIAATALHYELPIYTLNAKHLGRVQGLQLLPLV